MNVGVDRCGARILNVRRVRHALRHGHDMRAARCEVTGILRQRRLPGGDPGGTKRHIAQHRDALGQQIGVSVEFTGDAAGKAPYRILSGLMPLSDVLALAKSHEVSLTEYPVAHYMDAIARVRSRSSIGDVVSGDPSFASRCR